MKISTKGRYALRVMVDLSEHASGAYIPLKDVAERQEISQKYLESIMTVLSKEGFVDALQGKGGGYRLNRPASEYTVASVLRATEGALVPVACLEPECNPCSRAPECRTLPMWTELSRRINGYLEGVTVADLAQNGAGGDYII
jgi:Rrf2 family protein